MNSPLKELLEELDTGTFMLHPKGQLLVDKKYLLIFSGS